MLQGVLLRGAFPSPRHLAERILCELCLLEVRISVRTPQRISVRVSQQPFLEGPDAHAKAITEFTAKSPAKFTWTSVTFPRASESKKN